MKFEELLGLAWFPILGLMVAVWLILYKWTLNRLEQRHPQKYSEMGSPSLFLRNSLENNWKFAKYLWKNEYRKLEDSVLSRTNEFMKVFIVLYLLVFFGPMVSFIIPLLLNKPCLLYTSPSPRDQRGSRMPSSA